MAIKATDFVNKKKSYAKSICVGGCKKVLIPAVTGAHPVKKGFMCDDCYFNGNK